MNFLTSSRDKFEEISDKFEEISDKFEEIKDEDILPLQEDPCRSFFSRVTKWGDAVSLKKAVKMFSNHVRCHNKRKA